MDSRATPLGHSRQENPRICRRSLTSRTIDCLRPRQTRRSHEPGRRQRGRAPQARAPLLTGGSERAGPAARDAVDVAIELDTAPREVDVPDALATAVAADPGAKATFEGLSFTHRKEYARWVADAKREETRERRVAQAVQMLREGKTPS